MTRRHGSFLLFLLLSLLLPPSFHCQPSPSPSSASSPSLPPPISAPPPDLDLSSSSSPSPASSPSSSPESIPSPFSEPSSSPAPSPEVTPGPSPFESTHASSPSPPVPPSDTDDHTVADSASDELTGDNDGLTLSQKVGIGFGVLLSVFVLILLVVIFKKRRDNVRRSQGLLNNKYGHPQGHQTVQMSEF